MHINQHLSFHITVNVSGPLSLYPLSSLPPSFISLPLSFSFPHGAVASAQLQSANQYRNSNEWNCLWGESVSDGGPDD